jgi:PilZ domain
MNALKPKSSPSVDERRRSRRRQINRVAKIQFGSGTLPRDCLITDISDGGVRLHVEGFDVPDDFVLLLTGDDIGAKERIYRVVWRLGYAPNSSAMCGAPACPRRAEVRPKT